MPWEQSVTLAGQFAIWSLCVVLVNLAVGAYAVGRGTVRKARPCARFAVGSGVALVLILATATFSRLPMCLPPNMFDWLPKDTVICAGPLVGALFIVWFGFSVTITLCCRASPLGGLYVGWAAGDMLIGVGVGGGLTFGMKMLLKDAAAGGHIDSAWTWLWGVGIAIHAMAWASFFVQGAVIWLLCQQYPATSPRGIAPAPTAVGAGGTIAQEKTARCLRPERVDKLDEIVAGAADVFGAWRSGMSVCLVLYVAFLLVGAFGFLVGQSRSAGVHYTEITTAPPCAGCYCTARLPADSVEVTSDVLYSNDTWTHPNRNAQEVEPLTLDIYRSNATAAGAQLPLIMIIHGGGFNRGDKTEATVANEARLLAQHGFVTASINYRLTAAKGLPDVGSVRNAIRDAQSAWQFLLEQPGVDSSRVAVFGTSAGAIMAGTIGQVPLALPAEAEAWADVRARGRGGGDDSSIGSIGSIGSGGSSSSASSRWMNISAAVGVSGCMWQFLIDRDAPLPAPWLDIHGTQDSRVFPFLAELTHNYLNALGVPEERNLFATVPGGGHVDVRMEGQVDTWGAAVQAVMRPKYVSFFVHHMRLSGATCGD